MTRRMTSGETVRTAKARREYAIAREELRYPSAPRAFPTGITSMPIKVYDAETRRLIDEALARRAAS